MGLLAFDRQHMPAAPRTVAIRRLQGGTAQASARALFTAYLLPFEVTSVLILIAILARSCWRERRWTRCSRRSAFLVS